MQPNPLCASSVLCAYYLSKFRLSSFLPSLLPTFERACYGAGAGEDRRPGMDGGREGTGRAARCAPVQVKERGGSGGGYTYSFISVSCPPTRAHFPARQTGQSNRKIGLESVPPSPLHAIFSQWDTVKSLISSHNKQADRHTESPLNFDIPLWLSHCPHNVCIVF